MVRAKNRVKTRIKFFLSTVSTTIHIEGISRTDVVSWGASTKRTVYRCAATATVRFCRVERLRALQRSVRALGMRANESLTS
jgi:hypothetical protein